MRKLIGCVLALFVIVLVSPWVTGLWFERSYHQLITFYNLQGDFNIDLMHYHRGWWSSDAELHIEVINPEVLQYFAELGIKNPKVDVTFQQHIQHGPVIFNSGASPLFGLATIRNQVHLSNDIQAVMQSTRVQKPLVVEVKDFISFTGGYHKYFSISPFQVVYTKNNLLIQFNQGLQGNVWVSPTERRFSGDVILSHFVMSSGKNVLTVPKLDVQFKQYRTRNGLWLGQSGMFASEVDWNDENENVIHLSDVDFHGNIDEKSGELYGLKSLSVKEVMLDGRLIGPVHFQVSAVGLSSKGLVNLIAAYQKVVRRGELYESQLRQNITSLVPSMFSTKTEIKIDNLQVMAPEGSLQLSGKMYWLFNESSTDGLLGLYQDANANASLRVSKNFLNKIIDDISQLSYFRSISPERRDELLDLQSNLQTANQRNFLFISQLARTDRLSEDDAIQLLTLQRNDEPLEEYFAVIKKLYLDRQISRQLSYMLFWQYVAVKHQVKMLDQAFDIDQQIVKQQMQAQITQWIKDGYIKQEKNDYVISVQKDSGSIKVNGKEI